MFAHQRLEVIDLAQRLRRQDSLCRALCKKTASPIQQQVVAKAAGECQPAYRVRWGEFTNPNNSPM